MTYDRRRDEGTGPQARSLATTIDQAVMNLASLLRRIDEKDQQLAKAEAILRKATAPRRSDGTYNYSREAFEQMANDYFASGR